jgi:hypothetical protein
MAKSCPCPLLMLTTPHSCLPRLLTCIAHTGCTGASRAPPRPRRSRLCTARADALETITPRPTQAHVGLAKPVRALSHPSSRWPHQAHARHAGDSRAPPHPAQAHASLAKPVGARDSHAPPLPSSCTPLRVRVQASWMCRHSCGMSLFGKQDRKGVKENKVGYFGLFIYHFQFILFF